MRPLPDLDLARIAPMPREQKRRALEQMKLAWPPFSYGPMRRSALDILNIQAGPLATGTRTPWQVIEADIRAHSKSSNETNANLCVAEALYFFAEERKFTGRRQEFFALPIGVSEKVTYWSPAIVVIDGRPSVLFIDPRRTRKLSADGRRFVFSVMHERIRVADPDLAQIGLGIIQFANLEDDVRAPSLHTDDGIDLIDFDTLDSMVRETYALWREVLQEREEDSRRRAAGRRGPLI